jgi:hypothetical protein
LWVVILTCVVFWFAVVGCPVFFQFVVVFLHLRLQAAIYCFEDGCSID